METVDTDGSVFTTINRFTEIQSGLYYHENGQWLESQELIVPYALGAVAQLGQYKVIFGNNLNTLDDECWESFRDGSGEWGLD